MDEETRKKQREIFDRFRDKKITAEEFTKQYQEAADDDPGVTPEEEMRELGMIDDQLEEV